MLPLARRENLSVRETTEETIVYDLINHKAHCLNRTAALVWKHCDGRTNVTELARLLPNLDECGSVAVVQLALEQLARRQLLEKEPAAEVVVLQRQSRRDALKKVAAAMAALPLIFSLTAQRAHAQASHVAAFPPPCGGTCSAPGDPVCAQRSGPGCRCIGFISFFQCSMM